MTKIECAAKEVDVFCFVIVCNLRLAACDHFHWARLTGEEPHAFAGFCEQIKEWHAVTGKHTLLQAEAVWKFFFHGRGSHLEKMRAMSS